MQTAFTGFHRDDTKVCLPSLEAQRKALQLCQWLAAALREHGGEDLTNPENPELRESLRMLSGIDARGLPGQHSRLPAIDELLVEESGVFDINQKFLDAEGKFKPGDDPGDDAVGALLAYLGPGAFPTGTNPKLYFPTLGGIQNLVNLRGGHITTEDATYNHREQVIMQALRSRMSFASSSQREHNSIPGDWDADLLAWNIATLPVGETKEELFTIAQRRISNADFRALSKPRNLDYVLHGLFTDLRGARIDQRQLRHAFNFLIDLGRESRKNPDLVYSWGKPNESPMFRR